MDTNVLDWLEVTAAACPDKPAFLDEDGAVTFADVRREARIIGTAAARLRAGRKAPIAVIVLVPQLIISMLMLISSAWC